MLFFIVAYLFIVCLSLRVVFFVFVVCCDAWWLLLVVCLSFVSCRSIFVVCGLVIVVRGLANC